MALVAHGTPFGLVVLLYPGFLVLALRQLGPKQRFLCCLGWGLAFSSIFYVWALDYGLSAWLALTVARGLPWLVFPLFGWLIERHAESIKDSELSCRILEACAYGSGLALVSWLQLIGITGVDWETPAGGLVDFPTLLAVLPWTGLVGLAFLIAVVSVLGSQNRVTSRILALAVLVSWFVTGALLQKEPKPLEVTVALVQTGWSQEQKWDKDTRETAKDRLLALTEGAADNGAELVIWPETAWPYQGMLRRPSDTRKIGKLARQKKIDIIATSIEVRDDGGKERWLNSASLIHSTGKIGERFDKLRLAPFGEYIPVSAAWEETLRTFRMFSRISPFIPGEEELIFKTKSGLRFAVLICYESMTPARAHRLKGQVDFLVVSTNDSPFSSRIAREAHFRSAILRAVESGVPVLQSANTGVTGWINSQGRVQSRTNPGFLGPCVQYARPER